MGLRRGTNLEDGPGCSCGGGGGDWIGETRGGTSTAGHDSSDSDIELTLDSSLALFAACRAECLLVSDAQ